MRSAVQVIRENRLRMTSGSVSTVLENGVVYAYSSAKFQKYTFVSAVMAKNFFQFLILS